MDPGAEAQRRAVDCGIKPKQRYRHFRTEETYEIVGVFVHTETREILVGYTNQEKDLWVRPLEMFRAKVEHPPKSGKLVPRFLLLN